MEYTDLHQFPENHPPSPYNRPAWIVKDGHFGDGFLPKGLSLYAVGWLETQVFTTGQVSEDCIDALFGAHANHIIRDDTRGFHVCMFCNISTPLVHWRDQTLKLMGYGHYLVQMDTMVFMAPALVLHYILGHQYCPPQEFVDSTIHGRFLTQDDLDIRWRN